MDRFVIRRDDGKYVARPGSAHSYTSKLEEARLFATREAAERDCCGNERIIPLAEVFR